MILENLTQNRIIAAQIRSATDSASRRRGLLGIADLDPDSGLWLNPCEAIHTFRMRMALDVIFLDAALRVRKIARHLKPNRIAFCLSASSVLELKAGLADGTGLQCGHQLLLRPVSPRPPEPIAQPGFFR